VIAVFVESGEPGMSRSELQVLAPVEGQVLNLLAVHHPRDLARDGVDRSPWTDTSTTSLIPPTSSRKSA